MMRVVSAVINIIMRKIIRMIVVFIMKTIITSTSFSLINSSIKSNSTAELQIRESIALKESDQNIKCQNELRENNDNMKKSTTI